MTDAMKPGLSVEECVRRLKRFHYAFKRLHQIFIARLTAEPLYELKMAFSLHAHYCAEHVIALRKRVGEMREPPLGLEQVPDPNLEMFFDEILCAPTTEELLLGLYERALPTLEQAEGDHPAKRSPSISLAREFVHIFSLFFRKKEIVPILAFFLFYRLAETQLLKIIPLFLLDPRSKGGLELTTSELGVIYGTVGVISLVLGGLLGGYAIYRNGLKFWIWMMVGAIHLPDLVYVYLSHANPDNLIWITLSVAVEQFGYGFGFTAYTMFMIMVSEGNYKTVHYAICTGIMALGMMVPGMFSGWIQEQLGYQNFFLWVMAATIPGFISPQRETSGSPEAR